MTLPSDVNEGINQALEGSVRGDAVPYEGISSPAVTRDCPNRGRDLSANSSAAIEVADLATGNAPVKDSPLVGSNSGVSTSARVDAPEVSHVYLLSSEVVSLVEADRRTDEEVTCQN